MLGRPAAYGAKRTYEREITSATGICVVLTADDFRCAPINRRPSACLKGQKHPRNPCDRAWS